MLFSMPYSWHSCSVQNREKGGGEDEQSPRLDLSVHGSDNRNTKSTAIF
jgi:hypothetical protein